MDDFENPFAAPTTDVASIPIAEAPQLHGRMPGSVILAIACVGVFVTFSILPLVGAIAFGSTAGTGAAAPLVLVGVLVLVGLVMRNRLAWQWGRVTSVVGAVLGTLIVGLLATVMLFGLLSGEFSEIEMPDDSPFGPEMLSLFMLLAIAMYAIPPALLWTQFFALGRPAARAYYGLYCPKCESRRVKAADFLFKRARCKDCQAVW